MSSGRSFAFVVPGKPQAKERPRFNRKTGRAFTPSKTRAYERVVGVCAMDAVIGVTPVVDCSFDDGSATVYVDAWPLDASYRVTIAVYWPDERRRDIDNVSKAILDGLNGVAWNDDSQVDVLLVRRHIDRKCPRAEVLVEVVE